MVEPIPGARHQVYDSGSSLHYTIPSYKHWGMILFTAVWLVGWAVGMITVGGTLIPQIAAMIAGSTRTAPDAGPPSLFLMVWFTLWTMGGGWALFTLVWQLAGREKLDIDSMSVKLRREIFGIGHTREYLGEAFKEMRITDYDPNPWNRRRRQNSWGMVFDGPIVFDYGSKTFRCAGGLDQAEAKQILRQIADRYPQYVTPLR